MPASLKCNVCGVEYARTAEHWHRQPKNTDGLSETCKSCASARARAHYAANKNTHTETVRAYRKAHPEMRQRGRDKRRAELAAKQRAYYKRNAAAILAREKERRGVDAAKISEIRKRRYWADREASRANGRARMAAWAASQPERYHANINAYRARRKAAPGTVTAADIIAQYERQRGACFYCHVGFDGVYTVDHSVPLIRGGTNNPSNIVLACKPCNSSKKDKLPHEFTARG